MALRNQASESLQAQRPTHLHYVSVCFGMSVVDVNGCVNRHWLQGWSSQHLEVLRVDDAGGNMCIPLWGPKFATGLPLVVRCCA